MAPSDIAEKNIRTIVDREKQARDSASLTQKVAKAIAHFSGTVAFAVINAIFFTVWITLNLTFFKFDPYPFILLTLVVSLEAIFLSTFVLISQNELANQSEARHKLDLQINLIAEHENTVMSRVLIDIAEKLGIEPSKLEELKALTDDTSPEEVLEKITKVENEK